VKTISDPAPGSPDPRTRGDIDRIVLDTNVCLDLFVFDDPRCEHLRAALHAGEVVAMTDDACRDEWMRVLRYPELRLNEAMRHAVAARFDSTMEHRSMSPSEQAGLPPLPRCRDPDDQKFLELAQRTRARWLLTRDDHLLALAKRTRRQGLFAILRPSDWCSMRT
jgi:putative PIN family toxin of toxin-antitoxin system